MSLRNSWAESVLGVSIVLVVLLVAASPIWPQLLEPAGGAALVASVFACSRLNRTQQGTALVLAMLGAGTFAAASISSGSADMRDLLEVNQTILAMLAGVSFIAAASARVEGAPSRFRGAPALWRTGIVTHLLASVINFSAVSLVGDRLAGNRALRSMDAAVITRAFATAAFWSPFWAAGAVALAYAPEAKPVPVLLLGLLLASTALAVGIALLLRKYRDQISGYGGYPVSRDSLVIPVFLALLVVAGKLLFPEVNLTINVLWAALTAAALLAVFGGSTKRGLIVGHLRSGLPRMRGEFVLFVAAGFFSVGLREYLNAIGPTFRLEEFSALTAWVFVVVAVLVSLLGVHPLVTIATAAALLPYPIPNPTLFALSAMVAWGAATMVGPLSALSLLMAGRFGTPASQIVRMNLGAVTAVVVLSIPVFVLCEFLVPSIR